MYLTNVSPDVILSGSEIDSHDPSLIEYLKTLGGYNNEMLLIVEYNYNSKNHYASLIYNRRAL